MQNILKIVIAVALVALIAVIGLIVLNYNSAEPIPSATPEPEATQVPQPTAEPEEDAGVPESPDENAPQDGADNGDMYEGALAGLTEEEIGALAMAEEGASIEGAGEDGVD